MDYKEENSFSDEVSKGFGQFLVDVAALLTFVTVEKLATKFNYPPRDLEDYANSKNPGYLFVSSLKEKGIINAADISILTDALKNIDLHGVADDALRLFTRNCRNTKVASQTLSNAEALTTCFIRELKETYQELYNRVNPIPFIRDRLLCVNNVFIDSGIEFFHRIGAKEKWQKLNTYHDIFRDPRLASKRFILFGEPGYGKSTLALQFAFDWCNSCKESPLKNVSLLIFLKLRQLSGVTSIFRAIKLLLLPHESKLSESDIVEILYNSTSVVIVLDGFDEYAHKAGKDGDDVTKIISGRMFQKFLVILTTRPSCKPEDMAATTMQVRLNGFDSKAQSMYIEKSVVPNDKGEIERIKSIIEANPILRDLCEVPLFFTMFSYMIYEKQAPVTFESVTHFFRYIIGCFHEHMQNKLKEEDLKMYIKIMEDHSKLDKVAFDALAGERQQIIWMKEKLRKSIGKDLYDKYVDAGFLVEEETVTVNDTPGSPTSALIERNTHTSFYHKLFCEWFAAHYLSEYTKKSLGLFFSKTLGKLDPFDLQYVFRFACGINPGTSSKIIKHLKKLDGGDKFAVLCVLERTGEIDEIKETVSQMCFEGVMISGYDSLLLQRSSMQLLDIATKYKIPIERVILSNCLQSVDLSTEAINTTSGLILTSRMPVKLLQVSLYNREMTEDEAIAILEFSSMCPSLCYLWYSRCVPPHEFQNKSTLSTLSSRNVKVRWHWSKDAPNYILNLQTGRWENEYDRSEPTAQEFERMKSTNVDFRTKLTEEDYKIAVKQGRHELRELAEKRKKDTQ